MSFAARFLAQISDISNRLDIHAIERAVRILVALRKRGGRLFIIGSGGGAGHSSHAVCDFRKLCGIESYCPTDNISELTANINDHGWESSIARSLENSRLNSKDCLLVMSVGGGDEEKNVSVNLVNAIKFAKKEGAQVIGFVGRDGGYTKKVADASIIVPTVEPAQITPHTEAFQAVLWHLLVSHPELKINPTKWESTALYSEALLGGEDETRIHQIETKIFADGADIAGILEMCDNPLVAGFTTNPTLMRKAGISDYETFALEVLPLIGERPISFEVFSDDIAEMGEQARIISSWGENVYVKIPITTTTGESCAGVIKALSDEGVKVNITAIMTVGQVAEVLPALDNSRGAYISVFAGRIADTGRDPVPVMRQIVHMLDSYTNVELLWASTRELINIFQANDIGCDIITVTNDILRKLNGIGRDLEDYSLETVKMFYNDAKAAGFSLRGKNTRRASDVSPVLSVEVERHEQQGAPGASDEVPKVSVAGSFSNRMASSFRLD